MKTFSVGGKKYLLQKVTDKAGDVELKLVPFDKAEYDKLLTEIAKNLKKYVNKKEWIKQALTNMERAELIKIRNQLRKGVKPKAKKGCYEVTIGDSHVCLVG